LDFDGRHWKAGIKKASIYTDLGLFWAVLE
jgi:hypothetical protein